MDMNGKVVLITGASSGIGAQTAVEFAQAGASVAIHGRNVENLCRSAGLAENKILQVTGELTVEEECKKVVAQTVEHFTQLHVLVNNAGVGSRGTFEQLTMDELDKAFSVNVKSALMVTQSALPHLIKTKGSIVNMSSVAGSRPMPFMLAYGMSKAALNHFSQMLALEMAPKGVRVNAVVPGLVQTRDANNPQQAFMAKMTDKFAQDSHPTGRILTTQEVAKVMVYLASDAASGVTGALVPVDGAWCISTHNYAPQVPQRGAAPPSGASKAEQ